MISISNEDFLKQIYMLKSLGQKASTSALSKKLGISNAAVTDMSRKLDQQGYVNYRKYREIELTPNGEKIALGVVRRHRLWELFLNRILDIPWDKVHAEAERLEHHTSDFLIDEIDRFLNFPVVDPHGDPIPDKHGHLAEIEYIRLSEVNAPARVKLKRVTLHDAETLELLDRIYVAIDDEMNVSEYDADLHEYRIERNGSETTIPEKAAGHILVELIVKKS